MITLIILSQKRLNRIIHDEDFKTLTKPIWDRIRDLKLLSFSKLLSLFIAWMITNGWGYIFLVLGPILHIKWMEIVGITYISFLWLPCTPEKLITIPIAMFIYKIIKRRKK